jgi:hypothetical protein
VTPVRISIAAAIGRPAHPDRAERSGGLIEERYALLWLVTGVVLLVLSTWRGGLNTIAGCGSA